MKTTNFLRAAFALFLLLTLACSPGKPAPGADLPQLKLPEFHGQWVVINYWAQWCKPCLDEIPELNEFARAHPEVAVLGVNFDGATGEELATQVAAFNIEFPLILEDPSAVLGIPRPQALPTTVILNPEGEIAATLMGPQTLVSLRAAVGADKKAAP